MNPEVKDKWVAALEGGEFDQTTGSLLKVEPGEKDKMCCLGVLSELHARETNQVERGHDTDGCCWGYRNLTSVGGKYLADGMPHQVTTEWAELEPDEEVFLADLNDKGAPFMAIAAYIRKHL